MKNTAIKNKKWTLSLIASLMWGAAAMDANAEVYAYWQDHDGDYIRSGTGSCTRTGNWTAELATSECDPDLVSRQVATAAAVTDSHTAHVAPSETSAAVEKTIVTSDTLFDTDRTEIKPSGKATLDELVVQLRGNNSVIIPIGYASSPGNENYNLQLSERRAEAVKNYLVSQGIDSDRIYIASKGEQDPVADNSTVSGRARNQRVEIEVKGTPPPFD